MKRYMCSRIQRGCRFEVIVPGSKSMTNRALLLGALAEGKTRLNGVLFSEDTRVFIKALQDIGFSVQVDEDNYQITIDGLGGVIPECADERKVYVGSAGTAARFLTAMLALSGQPFLVESSAQMKARPMEPLLRALEVLGVEFEYLERPYAFPFRIIGKKDVPVDMVDLDIDASSQFLSGLLLCGVMCRDGISIHLVGTRDARAYVEISMKMMDEFGVRVEQVDENTYHVAAGQHYTGRNYQIEPDVSAACYFYGIAAVCGCEAKVLHVHSGTSQGDIRFLDVLEEMGCERREEKDGIVLTGPADGRLKGVHVVMTDFSDQTMTLAAIAPFADRETVIDGVGHIREQESDRIRGIVTELRRMGITCDEREDGITVYPGTVKPAVIHTYEDHRMAMAFAVTGCRAEGIEIDNPLCCKKTFENYFGVLTNLVLTNNIMR